MTKTEYERRKYLTKVLVSLGFLESDTDKLMRDSNVLRRWYARECGDSTGCISRDENTGKPYWLNSNSGKRYRVRDLESGALKRISEIFDSRNRNHRTPVFFSIQTDPRGAAIWVVRSQDMLPGHSIDECYSRGIPIY